MEILTPHTTLNKSDHPRVIFKFRDWKNKHHKLILTRKEIYLTPPKEFNDPFDCRIPESFELLNTDEKIDKFLRELTVRNFDTLKKTGRDINTFITLTKNDFKNNTEIYQDELIKKHLKNGDLYFGIFSTSKIWNNIQMWAHYSSNHTGFCVGFNREILMNNLPPCNVGSVHYLKKYPLIDPFDDFVQKSFLKSHTKELHWKYEKEYRFYTNAYPNILNRDKRKIILPKECFNCVMIGLNFPQNQEAIIKRLTENLEVPLYRIIKDKKSFNLKRIKINLP